MSKSLILSKVALGLATLTLSTGLFASTSNVYWHPLAEVANGVTDVVDNVADDVGTVFSDFDVLGVKHAMHGPEYLVTDKNTKVVKELDGVNSGKVVSHHGGMTMDEKTMMGDKIMNMHTSKTGIITGIKDQGTMEVTHKNGKTVRYQYVTFKVKHTK